jgi:hypothetical protein
LDEYGTKEELYGVPDEEGNLPPNIFTSFISHWQSGEFSFAPIQSFEKLQQCLEARLED